MVRWLTLAIALFAVGCGVTYVAPQAVVRLEFSSIAEMEQASQAIEGELSTQGFQTERQINQWPQEIWAELPEELKQRSAQTIVFWRHSKGLIREDLHGDLTSYGAGENTPPPRVRGTGGDPSPPHLDLSFSELRPGGFSESGRGAYQEILQFLDRQNYEYVVVRPPPPSNEAEHTFIVTTNAVAAGAWWLVSWAIGMAIFGAVFDWPLRAAAVSWRLRRVVLIGVGVLLATPMPTPSMFITLMIPNLFHALGGAHSYALLADAYGMLIPAAFLVSLGLSFLLARFAVRAGPATQRRVADEGQAGP